MNPVRYRPHHFLCSLGFEGKGYSPEFTANMTAIVMGRLRAPEGDATVIEVTDGFDDICAPCPRNAGSACTHQPKIDRLDAAHASALSLSPGERISWGEARSRIRARVQPGALRTLCAGCEWEPFGICEAALVRLHERNGAATGDP
jgi:hypothetical protein